MEDEVIEEVVEESTEESVEDSIRGAMVKEDKEVVESEVEEESIEEATEEVTEEEKPIEIEPVPQALSGAMKAKWKDLDADVRAEWFKRENDINQALTRHDGDLNMGRKMKEVINPYMPIIQAEGGTPEGAVKDLLNTAYVLRTGTPQQKAEIVRTVAQQYGVDLNQVTQPQQQVNPQISQLQNEIAQLRQMANPEVIKNQLQEEMEYANISKEVEAFAANPDNKYFEQVKPIMASLLSAGQAQDVQEAYDKACWSDPTIRTSLLEAQKAELEAKRKTAISAKKQASVSIAGSPELTSPKVRNSNLEIEDELRAAMQGIRGSV
jgi:TolA-binding protein